MSYKAVSVTEAEARFVLDHARHNATRDITFNVENGEAKCACGAHFLRMPSGLSEIQDLWCQVNDLKCRVDDLTRRFNAVGVAR